MHDGGVPAEAAAPGARARARARHAGAVRRARHAGRADRGDRARRRDRARAGLPALLLQGGAVRPHRHRLPRRARRRARATRSPRRPSPSTRLERCAEAYAGFCQRYPAFLDSALSLMHRPAQRAARDRLGVGLAAPRPGHGGLHRASSPTSCARATRRAPSRSTTPTTWPTCSGRRRSARCTSPASASACASSRPASPTSSASPPSRSSQACVASALATVGARR